MKATKSTSWFSRIAKWTSRVTGTPKAFGIALAVVLMLQISLGDRIEAREGRPVRVPHEPVPGIDPDVTTEQA